MIPLVDLKAQYRSMRGEIQTTVLQVLESGQFASGQEVAAFEDEFARYCGADYSIAVNSGTSALHLALLAAGIGPGDEVITVPFTFVATVAAIHYAGARPVFTDIEPRYFTMNADRIEEAITARTKAILPVHLYGHAANMTRIMEIARRRGLVVIEDAAQAHGAETHGRRAGSVGDLGCFSFYPSKNLGACGEGGMIVTNSAEYARTLRLLRDWGQEEKYSCSLRGYNYRMDELQGAILRAKLRHLEAWTEARRAHAAQYNRGLSGCGLETPAEAPFSRHVYHLYVVRTARRDGLLEHLLSRDIRGAIHYPVPVHLQKPYADAGHRPGAFPQSERAAREVLSLPMYAELSESQIERVSAAVREALH